MADFEDITGLDTSVDALETSMGAASSMTVAFEHELSRMSETMGRTGREVGQLSNGVSRGLKRAIDGLVFDGGTLSDALETVAKSMVNTAYSIATRPVTQNVGGMIAQGANSLLGGLFQFENGASFAQGRVTPFASGGVVGSPTYFPMRGGTGLMGEAGPEAIMPLSRGPDGRLGVQSQGGGRPVNVVMNITAPDAQSFQRSQSQIAAQMGRALGRGQRNR
ncbi:phage tail tape measure protein [Cochlodiniinecator piscidefendens]|uniref:phage tail tape measure protein n=1 Tax=Cochlodiniinecator piscidefendens TaxID=2715756 RepID=UPI00140E4B9E|nr:phage tail tape measure protein [Cochlodiniinecator piscidefendens]